MMMEAAYSFQESGRYSGRVEKRAHRSEGVLVTRPH